MADLLLAAIKALVLPLDAPPSGSATEASLEGLSTRPSPRTSVLPVSAPAATKTSTSASFDPAASVTSTEAVTAERSPPHGCLLPAASGTEANENPSQMASTAGIPFATTGNVASATADSSPHREGTISSTPSSPNFCLDDFHFVTFADAEDDDAWPLIADDCKTFNDADISAQATTTSLVDSLGHSLGNQSASNESTAPDVPPYQKLDSLESLELLNDTDVNFRDSQFDGDRSSLSSTLATSPLISLPSSDSEDFDFPESSEPASEADVSSDCSGIGFKELFNESKSDELDWEDDHFHDCGDEFNSEMNESFYSQQEDSEPLLPLEESSSTGEECLGLLFHEEENDLEDEDHKMLDVVEELQPSDFKAGFSGYPVNDLPILEGNFFHLADTPPYEEETESRQFHTSHATMFLFEIPAKFNEETLVQEDMSANVLRNFVSQQDLNKCDIVFGDFDTSRSPTSLAAAEEFPSPLDHSPPSTSMVTPPLSPRKSASLSSLPPSEDISCASSDSLSSSCSSPTLSSDFLPCTDNFSTYNEVDQLDSLEEKCFKLYEDGDREASFDCFPMRLQSARKVDYRGCGTRKTRRMRKRW